VTEAIQQEIRTLRSLHNSERDPEGRVFAPLADAYRRAGQISDAVSLLEEGLARHPDFVPGHVVAAQVYVEQGLADEANGAARRALELDPDNVSALRSLLKVLRERGKADEAVEVRDHLVALEPDFAAEEEPWVSPAPAASDVARRGRETRVLDEMADAREEAGPAEELGFGAAGMGSLDLGPEASLEEGRAAPSLADADATLESDFDLADVMLEPEATTPSEDPSEAATLPRLGALTPDPEPVFELDSMTQGGEGSSDPDVSDFGLLSVEEPPRPAIDDDALPEEEPVYDLGALAPDEPEEPVMDLAMLAPDEPEEPVMDLAMLAPDEPEEPAMDLAMLAPDGPAMDVASLAPNERILDLDALAADEPDGSLPDLEALAAEMDADAAGGGDVDLPLIAPDEPGAADESGEIIIDLDALRPEAADEEEAEAFAARAGVATSQDDVTWMVADAGSSEASEAVERGEAPEKAA